jgi:hypothetical protein
MSRGECSASDNGIVRLWYYTVKIGELINEKNWSRDNVEPTVMDGRFVLPSQQRNVELFVKLFLVGQRQHLFAGVDSVNVGVATRT